MTEVRAGVPPPPRTSRRRTAAGRSPVQGSCRGRRPRRGSPHNPAAGRSHPCPEPGSSPGSAGSTGTGRRRTNNRHPARRRPGNACGICAVPDRIAPTRSHSPAWPGKGSNPSPPGHSIAPRRTPLAQDWHRSSSISGNARVVAPPSADRPPPHCVRIPGSLGIPGRRSWADISSCLRHAAVIEGAWAAIKEILYLHCMNLAARIKSWWGKGEKPLHLRHGELGERAAKKQLKRQGLKFLTANFRTPRGEIDLIFRDGDCLVFVEVKARSSEEWVRPAAAVNAERRRRLTRAALDYLRLLKNPPVKVRFDIVEVLLQDSVVREVRHLPNTFAMEHPYRYG